MIPRWLSRRTVLCILGAGIALTLGYEIIDAVRAKGLVAGARQVGILASVGVVVYLLARLMVAVGNAIGRTSEDFRGFVANLLQLLGCVGIMLVGATLHARWSAGEDIVPTLLFLAMVLIWGIFREGKNG